MDICKTHGNKMRGYRYCLEGSFTVEAAYLLPRIFFLILNLLYLSFFLYDQSTIMQGCYCTALRTERLTAEEDVKEEEAETKYEKAVAEKVVCGSVEKEIDIAEEGVTAKATFDMKAPAGLVFQSDWQGEQKQTAEAWQPVEFIRNCRKAENLLEYIQTGNG